MYPVNNRLHTLAFEENVKTRIRVYFISDSVDCTDDDDVQTNGTLLVGAAGDTDSNGRISFDQGVTFNEYFNPDKNIQIGAAVSSNVTMTLLNYDGALDGFSYGRCKIYLDAYDDENSVWLPCPMGVYIIDIPVKRKTKLVNVIGYDQMQKFDGICDAWWSSLNWSGGITLSQLLTSLATQIGVSVSSNTASAIVNGSVSFTEEPFQCNEVTYREVLEYIAEATGTVARFDRNGALDLRWFAAAQISGNTVTVNTDTVGNQCLAISVAEYSVAAVDLLKVKLYTDDIGITVGTGTNQYTIVNNLFLDGDNSSAIIAKATPIYNRLHGLDAYSPVSARIITDWSIEAGDIINIVNDSITYSVPIFQQSMAWRGGYVVSDFLSDGDNVRPVLDYDERTYYRLNSEMSKKVGDNEIISKINQSPEQITIQANKINLIGTVTANDGFVVNQDGTVEMNGATVNGTITVGGANNVNGVLYVKDANGDLCGRIDNNGLTVFQYELGRLNSLALSGGYMKMKTGDTTAAFLNRTTQGAGVFGVYDSQGRQRAAIRGSTANVLAIDPNGLVRAEIASDGTLALTDSNNVRRFYMGLGGLFTVKDASGNVRYQLDSTNGSVVSKDAGEVTRCKLNNTGLTVYDSNGNAIGSLLEVSGKSALTVDNATINGVLDVTQRRCYATLSSAGWYRVVTFDVRHTGSVIEFYIGRQAPSGTPAENHKISFFMNGGGLSSFVDETSRASTVLIDKIRLNYVGYTGYIDIHYTSSSTNDVFVSFNVYGKLQQAGTAVSMGLVSVADSPSGENQSLLYTFAANTVYHDEAKVSGLTHVIDRVGNVVTVTLHAEGQATYCTSNTATTIYTIPSGYRPKSDVYFVADAYGANLLISGTAKSDGSVVLIPINADASWYRMTFTYIV